MNLFSGNTVLGTAPQPRCSTSVGIAYCRLSPIFLTPRSFILTSMHVRTENDTSVQGLCALPLEAFLAQAKPPGLAHLSTAVQHHLCTAVQHQARQDEHAPCSGDGAGLLVAMPEVFLKRCATEMGFELPPRKEYGVGMAFLPQDDELRASVKASMDEVQPPPSFQTLSSGVSGLLAQLPVRLGLAPECSTRPGTWPCTVAVTVAVIEGLVL